MDHSISEAEQVHVLFVPLMIPEHMLQLLDVAELFAARGAKSTVVATARTAAFFSKSDKIDLRIVELGFQVGSGKLDADEYYEGLELMRAPVEELVGELRPNGIVADMFYTWASEVAAKHGIPAVSYQVSSFFSTCVVDCLKTDRPYEGVRSDSEEFVLAGMPGELKMTRLMIGDHIRLGLENDMADQIRRIWERAVDSMKKCHGTIVNSVYEIEPDFADHYRGVLGRRAWHVGPVSLHRRKIGGGGKSDFPKWLNSKKPNSVIYVCFWSWSTFSDEQMRETATGLLSSGQNFIWVIPGEMEEKWLPKGYEDLVGERGLIIQGWAPRAEILRHVAVGGFLTHCEWNSILEGLAAGVPMLTWPLTAEQFYNEQHVTKVMNVGVSVGAERCVRMVDDIVKSEAIEKAVIEVMTGARAEDMRDRVKKVGELTNRAVEVGGSSYFDLGTLIEELRTFRFIDKK